MKVTMIYYHVPTDQDDPLAPNAFPISKPRAEVKLKDIREKFPLPGSYHFRFKMKWNDNSSIWMDVTNEDSVVPNFDDKIICKVLRISWEGGPGGGGSGSIPGGSSHNPQQNMRGTPQTTQHQLHAGAAGASSTMRTSSAHITGGGASPTRLSQQGGGQQYLNNNTSHGAKMPHVVSNPELKGPKAGGGGMDLLGGMGGGPTAKQGQNTGGDLLSFGERNSPKNNPTAAPDLLFDNFQTAPAKKKDDFDLF